MYGWRLAGRYSLSIMADLQLLSLGYILLIVLLALAWLWAGLALFYAGHRNKLIRYSLLTGFVIVLPLNFYLATSFWGALTATILIYSVFLLWWRSLRASNEQRWQPPVAKTPYGNFAANMLDLHNVRNFHYRDINDYDQHWEVRQYDLSAINSLDLYLSYWGSRHMAHTILSWGFANGDYLAVSIEARKTIEQAYSSIQGFFKQFALIYIAADEKDLIYLRTNIRKEEVYLYPLRNVSAERARALLESYLAHINRLNQDAEFYHALQMNCTSTITLHTKTLDPQAFIGDWRLLVNGYVDKMLYDHGVIYNEQPFEQTRAQSRVDLRMQEYDNGSDFSKMIRAGLPGPARQ